MHRCLLRLLEALKHFKLSCFDRQKRVIIWKHCRWISPQTEHVFHVSLAHWGSLNQHSNSLDSSCSALIPLCFLMHWPGMWCYFITEAEATSSVSSPRAPATHSLTWTGALYVIITEWLSQTSSVAYGKSKSSREKLWSQEVERGAHINERGLKGLDRKKKNRNKHCIKELSSAMDPDDNELGIFTVIQWVVRCGLVVCAYFIIQSYLITHSGPISKDECTDGSYCTKSFHC